MPTSAGEYYAEAGRSLGAHISSAFQQLAARRREEDKQRQQVQGILDVAKTIQVNDPKTGKPKAFFTPDQVQMVQHLLDQHKAYQAGAAAASLGMGKGILQRAAQMNQTMQGPIYKQDQYGVHQYNPHTGVWSTVNPRDPNTGLTAGQSATQTRLSQAARARTQDAQQKQFDSTLKGLGINRQQLFDPHALEGGAMVGGQFYVPGQIDPNTGVAPIPADKDGNFDQSKITAFRVGYRAPVWPTNDKGVPKKDLPPIDKGKPGTVIQPEDLQAYRDQALSLADPKFKQALMAPQWALGQDPEAPTNPQDPGSQTVGQVLQNAQDYAESMRKAALTNPEYRRRVLGAATSAATDTTTQMQMPSDTTVNPVQQATAPGAPEEDDSEGE